MSSLPNFIPDALSDASGKEIQKLSFLGPFLQLSVFATDDVSWLICRPKHIYVKNKLLF